MNLLHFIFITKTPQLLWANPTLRTRSPLSLAFYFAPSNGQDAVREYGGPLSRSIPKSVVEKHSFETKYSYGESRKKEKIR